MSMSLVGYGAGWDRLENDYALVVDVYEDYFKLEKIDHYDPRKVFDRYLKIKEKNKDLTIDELGAIIEKGKTRHDGNIKEILNKHIQKDKKILIILSGFGPFLLKRKEELSELLKSDNIQLQMRESHRVKLPNDT
jgi:hypothetical protein